MVDREPPSPRLLRISEQLDYELSKTRADNEPSKKATRYFSCIFAILGDVFCILASVVCELLLLFKGIIVIAIAHPSLLLILSTSFASTSLSGFAFQIHTTFDSAPLSVRLHALQFACVVGCAILYV